jgi:large subunit ribosomal protein L24e
MVVDSTLNFAARRNIPIKYNRELVQTTLKGIKRIEEIRLRRERVFYINRMAGHRTRDLEEDRKLVEDHQHLLPPSERYNFTSLADAMDVDEQLNAGEMEQELSEEELSEEVSELDFSDEELQLPVKIKAKLPKAALKQKKKMRMRVDGGTEEEL